MRSIYYAAPFFNPREFGVMNEVARIVSSDLRKERLKVFFPYQASQEFQANIQDPASRREVFRRNEQALRECTEVVAWVDRLQMDEQQVMLCKPIRYEQDGHPVQDWLGTGKALTQPDLGTVWEMGFAHALRKTTAVFTLQDQKDSKLNLMLTESADIVLYGWEQLTRYLDIPRSEQVMPYIRDQYQMWKGSVE